MRTAHPYEVIQQKAALRFVRVLAQIPRAGRLADRVPGPHGSRLDRFAIMRHAAHLAPLRFDVNPRAILDVIALGHARIHIQHVLAVNLPQPRVLRVPRVIHRHRALRDGGERILREIGRIEFERGVPERQRIEILLDTRAQMLGRLPSLRASLRGETELLHHIGIELNEDRRIELSEAFFHEPFQIRSVLPAHVLQFLGHRVMEDAVVLRVFLPLIRIRFADERVLAVLAAPADQKAHARTWRSLMIDDEVRISAILVRTVGRRNAGSFRRLPSSTSTF